VLHIGGGRGVCRAPKEQRHLYRRAAFPGRRSAASLPGGSEGLVRVASSWVSCLRWQDPQAFLNYEVKSEHGGLYPPGFRFASMLHHERPV